MFKKSFCIIFLLTAFFIFATSIILKAEINFDFGLPLYRQTEVNFEKTKTSIKNVNPKFICGDIMNISLNRNYDNIFLSNLGQYFGSEKLKELVEKQIEENNQMELEYKMEEISQSESNETTKLIEENEPKEEIIQNEKPLLDVSTHISDNYTEDDNLKISIHKQINTIDSLEKLKEVQADLEDRFGTLDELTK